MRVLVGARPPPGGASPLEPLPVQRDAPFGRVQRRCRLPRHLAHGRPPHLRRLVAQPGPGLRHRHRRDLPLPPSSSGRVHRRHLCRRHVRLRRVHDRPDRPHRSHQRCRLAALDGHGRSRPHPPPTGRGGAVAAPSSCRRPPARLDGPAGRFGGPDHLERRRRGHHRQRRPGRHLHHRPSGRGRRAPPRWASGGPVLGGRCGRRNSGRCGPRRGPVDSRCRLRRPVATGHHHVHLLHQWLPPVPGAHPDRLALRARSQRGPPGKLRRSLQLSRGDQLCGGAGPHRRLLAGVAPLPHPTRGSSLVDLVRGPGGGHPDRPGRPDSFRPRDVPGPGGLRRAPPVTQSPAGRLLVGRPPRVVDAPPAGGSGRGCVGRPRAGDASTEIPAPAPMAEGGADGDHRDLSPAGLHGRRLPLPVDRRSPALPSPGGTGAGHRHHP